MAATATRVTALAARHHALGARFIEFAGWEMPVRYASMLEEHRAVRHRAGLFDVSHMGQIWVTGPGAGEGLSYATVGDPATLAAGRAEYSLMCAPDGGIVDDLIVYRLGPERYLVVANASNKDVVLAELISRLRHFDARVEDASDDTSMLALQGPRSEEILGEIATGVRLAGLRAYAIADCEVAGVPAMVARTGYTGEDGFEIFCASDDAGAVWDALLAAGERFRIMPVGLGARDTLRLEAAMPLYGNELDRETNPFEVGLGRCVKFRKPGDFVGRGALERAAAAPTRALAGLVLHGRHIARHGYPVFVLGEDLPCGTVTSGAPSPTLNAPIAMALLRADDVAPGTEVFVDVRGERVPAEIVTLPFYRRTKEAAG